MHTLRWICAVHTHDIQFQFQFQIHIVNIIKRDKSAIKILHIGFNTKFSAFTW